MASGSRFVWCWPDIARRSGIVASAIAARRGRRPGLVFLAQPVAATTHVQDEENGEGDEHHEVHGVH
jgi:hypothetical protein